MATVLKGRRQLLAECTASLLQVAVLGTCCLQLGLQVTVLPGKRVLRPLASSPPESLITALHQLPSHHYCQDQALNMALQPVRLQQLLADGLLYLSGRPAHVPLLGLLKPGHIPSRVSQHWLLPLYSSSLLLPALLLFGLILIKAFFNADGHSTDCYVALKGTRKKCRLRTNSKHDHCSRTRADLLPPLGKLNQHTTVEAVTQEKRNEH